MRKRARTDLSGGRSAMSVPTGTGTLKTARSDGSVPAGTSRIAQEISSRLEDLESVYFPYLFAALPIDGPALARS
jgi:hypothetical protein